MVLPEAYACVHVHVCSGVAVYWPLRAGEEGDLEQEALLPASLEVWLSAVPPTLALFAVVNSHIAWMCKNLEWLQILWTLYLKVHFFKVFRITPRCSV